MSQLREYAGKGWHEWPSLASDIEDVSLASSPSHSDLASGDLTPSSSRASSPHMLPKDDVTKLPRHEMHIFGQCPEQDEFRMAVCETCGLIVKLEALLSHVKLRHGLPLRVATASSSRSRNRTPKPCSVDMAKLTVQLKSERAMSSGRASSSSGSCPPPSRSKTPTPDKELVPTIAAPIFEVTKEEPMEVDEVSSAMTAPPTEIKVESRMPKFEEMDASSSNVISIPDTDPLPHNMSGDLMAMVSEVSRPMDTDDSAQSSSPSFIRLQVEQDENSTTTLLLAPPLSTAESSNEAPSLRNQAIVVQSPSSVPVKILPPGQMDSQKVLPKQSPAKKPTGGVRSDRKPLREYHPDKHCGVWDSEGSRNCTRALTCKSHSVLLKRKVEGRCKPFDELLADHKKAQQQQQLQQQQVVSSSPLPVTVSLPQTPVPVIQTVQLQNSRQVTLVSGKPPPPQIVLPLQPVKPQQLYHQFSNPKEAEESLHYTTDHPRPLAVCNFGARRIGGLLFSDRSRLLTRKLVRVALSSGVPGMSGNRASGIAGFHRIAPRVTLFQGESPTIISGIKRGPKEPPTFLLNYTLTGGPGKRTVMGNPIQGSSAQTAPTVNLSTLQPGSSVVIPESFKTDIQDFKGGIKFELGNKIQPIHLPADLP